MQDRRDVLEYPISEGLDVSGWDIKKALVLFARSNPPLMEWLRSPIVYRDDGGTAPALRALALRYFSPRSCMHHSCTWRKATTVSTCAATSSG